MNIEEYNRTIMEGLSEYEIQCRITLHLNETYPDILWTASAGGMRTTPGTGRKMKLAGYSKGCPDIFIFESRKTYIGLVIELKKFRNSNTTPEQKKWIKELNKRGYFAVVCCGFDEAKKVIDDYFSLQKM